MTERLHHSSGNYIATLSAALEPVSDASRVHFKKVTEPSIEAKSVCTYQYILDAYILMCKQMSGNLLTWRLSPDNVAIELYMNMLFLQRLYVVFWSPHFLKGFPFLAHI